jgi:hypothetical protein
MPPRPYPGSIELAWVAYGDPRAAVTCIRLSPGVDRRRLGSCYRCSNRGYS